MGGMGGVKVAISSMMRLIIVSLAKLGIRASK